MNRILSPLLIGSLLFVTVATAADVRYLAELADGTRVEGNEVRPWHDERAEPALSGKKLFDPKNPAVWLMDLAQPATIPPQAMVEFVGGDVLPGEVVGYRYAQNERFEGSFPFLIVETSQSYSPPDHRSQRHPIRVSTRWLRRVVWQRKRSPQFRPSTVFLRDGRQLPYRALRWSDGAVRLLRDEGPESYAFSQIAELHLPEIDPWEAHYEQLAILSPDCETNLIQIETSDGLRLTTSHQRFAATNHHNGGDPRKWYQRVQPAWSEDPLWVRYRSIRDWRFYPPHWQLVSNLQPEEAAFRRALAVNSQVRTNLNVQGGALRSASKNFSWGLGVHAYTRLEYTLPPFTKTFRTSVGLDEIAGGGGCARGQILLDGKTVFQSPVLVGSEKFAESPEIEIKGSGRKELVLLADPVFEGRPDGSDPLDIRDTLNWLEPVLELDRHQLAAEVRRRAAHLVPAFQGWEIEETGGGAVSLVSRWDDAFPDAASYRMAIRPRERLLSLHRRAEIHPDNKWLVLAVSRLEKETAPTTLQIDVNGKSIGKFDVPVRRNRTAPVPVLVPLEDYLNEEIEIRILQLPGGPQAIVDWRAISLLAQPPGLWQVFEDDKQLIEDLNQGEGMVAIEYEDRYTGSAALKVTPRERANPNVPGMAIQIREHPQLGEFRYIRFAWRKEGGNNICLQLANDGQWGPDKRRQRQSSYRYEAGKRGDRSYGAAHRVSDKLPKEWEVITRDLYSDFGECTITGISLTAEDGSHALFDHIYFARTMQDFEFIKMNVVAAEK